MIYQKKLEKLPDILPIVFATKVRQEAMVKMFASQHYSYQITNLKTERVKLRVKLLRISTSMAY